MKKKKFKWLKISALIIVIIFILIVILDVILGTITDDISSFDEETIDSLFIDYTVTEQNMTAYVKGTGEITSFNIQTLDISSSSSIKETFVSDGDIVSSKQKLLRIVTDGYSKNIESPIDGMYFETETNGLNVYQVYDLKNIGLEMYVSETDVALLKVGQKAFVRITALNKEVEGSVSYISKLPTDGKFKVKIKIEYTDEIRFGYGASIRIAVAEKENVLVIPYSVLQMDSENKYYVIKKEFKKDFYNSYLYNTSIKETAKTYVETGIITNSQVEIISGLNAGDIVEEWNN